MKNRRNTLRSWALERLESIVKIVFVLLLVVSLATGNTTAGAAELPMSSQIDGPLDTGNSVESVISVLIAVVRLSVKALLLNMGIDESSTRDHCLRQVFSTASSDPMDTVADFLIGETLIAWIPVNAFLRTISVAVLRAGPIHLVCVADEHT